MPQMFGALTPGGNPKHSGPTTMKKRPVFGERDPARHCFRTELRHFDLRGTRNRKGAHGERDEKKPWKTLFRMTLLSSSNTVMRAAGSTERRTKEENSNCSGTDKSDGEAPAAMQMQESLSTLASSRALVLLTRWRQGEQALTGVSHSYINRNRGRYPDKPRTCAQMGTRGRCKRSFGT